MRWNFILKICICINIKIYIICNEKSLFNYKRKIIRFNFSYMHVYIVRKNCYKGYIIFKPNILISILFFI